MMTRGNKGLREGRCGMTLIELLVVVGIIGVTVAIALPAVQAAREAMRRLECSNSIKQLGLALHNYETAHRAFPLNSSFGDELNVNTRSRSWLQGVLPYLEQKTVHQSIDRSLVVGANREVGRTVIDVFRCPSDTAGERLDQRADVPEDWELALTSYKSNGGNNWAWGSFRRAADSGRFAGRFDGMQFGNGFQCAGRAGPVMTRVRDIRDGLSNTFAIGETLPELTRWSWWFHSNHAAATCAVPLNHGIELDDHHLWEENNGFMSRHSGGAEFGMADGSVRFVSDSIDYETYQGLASIDGGE